MSVRKRRLLIVVLFALFFILAPALVLYAYGWRLDFAKFQLTKVGGVFLKHLPANATVALDGQPIKKRPQKFLTGTLIGNLLPDNYLIKIELGGYQSWEKSITVESAFVVETKPIILVPEKGVTPFFQKPISDFWINGSVFVYRAPDGNLYLTKVGDLENRTNLSLMFNNLKERILNFPGSVPIVEVLGQESSNEWVLNTANASYLLDFKKLTLELLKKRAVVVPPALTDKEKTLVKEWAKKFDGSVKKISLYPDNEHLFVTIGDDLYFVELTDQTPLNYWLITGGVKKHYYNEDRIYFLKNNGVYYLEM